MNHAIKVTNVRNSDDGLEIFLQRSKTDQYETGVTIHLAPQGDKQLCPVQTLNVFLIFRPTIDGILFCHFDGQPLTKYQFSSMLKRSLSVLDMSHSKLSSHSFRIGMATQCAIDGYLDEQIMRFGRWRSNVYLRYIRIPN